MNSVSRHILSVIVVKYSSNPFVFLSDFLFIFNHYSLNMKFVYPILALSATIVLAAPTSLRPLSSLARRDGDGCDQQFGGLGQAAQDSVVNFFKTTYMNGGLINTGTLCPRGQDPS